MQAPRVRAFCVGAAILGFNLPGGAGRALESIADGCRGLNGGARMPGCNEWRSGIMTRKELYFRGYRDEIIKHNALL